MENYIDAAFGEEKREPAAEETKRVTRRPFATWEVGGETYRMKLTTADVQELEQRYKTNLTNVMTGSDDGLPALTVMLDIARQAMQRYHHGMTMAKVVNLFDQYVDEGGSQLDFYGNVFTDIFLVSGFFSKARVQKLERMQADLNDGTEL